MYHNIEEIYYQREKELALESLYTKVRSIKKWILDKIDELIIAVRKTLLIETFKDKKVRIPDFVEEDLKNCMRENEYILYASGTNFILLLNYNAHERPNIQKIVSHTSVLIKYMRDIRDDNINSKITLIDFDPNTLLDILLVIKKSIRQYKYDNGIIEHKSVLWFYNGVMNYIELLIKYCKKFIETNNETGNNMK